MSTEVLLRSQSRFALGLPIVIVLWRVFVVGGELRRDERYGRAAIDIARRADMSLDELAVAVGRAAPAQGRSRGGRGQPSALCAEALRRYSQEAAIVDRHVAGAPGGGLQAEIERAQRAVELIEHGRELMLELGIRRNGRGRDVHQARLPEPAACPRRDPGEGRRDRRGDGAEPGPSART